MRHLFIPLLALASLLALQAGAQRADFGTLKSGNMVVTGETDTAAMALFNAFTNSVRVSVTNDRASRASEDARVLGIASNLFSAAQAARLAGDTNLAATVETFRTNLLQHFTALVDAERSSRATNVSAWAEAITSESRATNSVTRSIASAASELAQQAIALTSTIPARVSEAVATNKTLRLYTADTLRWIDGSNISYRVWGGYYAWYLSIPERGFLSEIRSYRGNESTEPGIEGAPENVDNVPPYTVEFCNFPAFGWTGRISAESDTYIWGLSAAGTTNLTFEPSQNVLSNAAVWRTWVPVQTSVVYLADSETKELHTDSYTNLIWRTVWSNGWMIQQAFTNTP